MTMQATQTCPGCAGKKFAVTPFRQRGRDMSNGGLKPLAPVVVNVRDRDVSILGVQVSNSHHEFLGNLNLWICLGCGYSEMYAEGLAGIEELAQRCPDQLVIVDATSKQGPYR
jgi:predicted nucleic-acid-binding Zn-ribbon protein